jgi:hypothetical protein
MPQYMRLNQAGWPTVCPSCKAELDWEHSESTLDEIAKKQTAYFIPVCRGRRQCTQDQMRLTRKAYPNLSADWRPMPANRLPQGVTV